ncbi:hypothetical protein PR048_028139 [Dryococelus australis]|uniref:Uncharacterized protein n=1 Tax=Dryococelus australis TaxID=614101 RepID=A0ABQ9GIF1_9NEOP|nr:hypothetical protein PR048_028139 [Dryococelus australis]
MGALATGILRPHYSIATFWCSTTHVKLPFTAETVVQFTLYRLYASARGATYLRTLHGRGDIWTTLNIEVLRANEVSMEQRRNERAVETGDTRGNPAANSMFILRPVFVFPDGGEDSPGSIIGNYPWVKLRQRDLANDRVLRTPPLWWKDLGDARSQRSGPVGRTRPPVSFGQEDRFVLSYTALKRSPQWSINPRFSVGDWLGYSPPTEANRIRFPVGSPREIFACGNCAGRCRWSAGYLGDLPRTPILHSGTAPYSPRFTLIGSQYLVVKRCPNFFTSLHGTQSTISYFFEPHFDQSSSVDSCSGDVVKKAGLSKPGLDPAPGSPPVCVLYRLLAGSIWEEVNFRVLYLRIFVIYFSLTPAGSPDFRKWESCRTMPLVGGFSRGYPVSPAPSFRRRSIFTSITLIGSQDLVVKRRPNLLTHSLFQLNFIYWHLSATRVLGGFDGGRTYTERDVSFHLAATERGSSCDVSATFVLDWKEIGFRFETVLYSFGVDGNEVDRSRWLRTTNLRLPTLNRSPANTSDENGELRSTVKLHKRSYRRRNFVVLITKTCPSVHFTPFMPRSLNHICNPSADIIFMHMLVHHGYYSFDAWRRSRVRTGQVAFRRLTNGNVGEDIMPKGKVAEQQHSNGYLSQSLLLHRRRFSLPKEWYQISPPGILIRRDNSLSSTYRRIRTSGHEDLITLSNGNVNSRHKNLRLEKSKRKIEKVSVALTDAYGSRVGGEGEQKEKKERRENKRGSKREIDDGLAWERYGNRRSKRGRQIKLVEGELREESNKAL